MIVKTGAGAMLAAILLGGAALAAHGSSSSQLAAAISAPQDPKCPTGATTVTVDGYGTAEEAPNELTITLGIQTQAAKATASLNANSTKANALIAELTSDGVAQKDIQTSDLSIQPVYTGPKRVLTGYQVDNTLTVTLLDLSRAGTIIDDAAQIAGNSVVVNGISFSVHNDATVLAEARAAAVRQAVGQAHAMASAAGLVLGQLCSLVDNTAVPEPSLPEAAAPLAASSTPVEPGEEQVTADVTAVYELEAS